MVWFCLNLGIIRAFLAEVVNQGDVSHGSHWNIFLILCAIMLISVFIPNVLIPYTYLLAFVISLGYEFALKYGLESYLIPWRQHNNFIGRNAVGMFQTVGYLSCYLVGLGFGRRLYKIAYEDRQDEDKAILFEILLNMGLCLAVFLFSYFVFAKTGPAATNLAYVSYVLASGYFTILCMYIPERIISIVSANMIYDAPAKSSRLIYFIIANILTGVINFIFDLRSYNMALQTFIMVMYLLILHGIFAMLVNLKVNVRFW